MSDVVSKVVDAFTPWRARWAAVALSLAAAWALGLARDLMAPTTGAVLLVLPVLAAAATGDRAAGLLGTAAATAGFDFFLTAPYFSLEIQARDAVEAAIALGLVGIAATELAQAGRRHHIAATRREVYLSGLTGVLDLVPTTDLTTRARDIAPAITRVLGADRTEWRTRRVHDNDAVVGPDGRVTLDDAPLNVSREGLPTSACTAIPVSRDGEPLGHFLVITATRPIRPTPEQLRVARLLADSVAERHGWAGAASNEELSRATQPER